MDADGEAEAIVSGHQVWASGGHFHELIGIYLNGIELDGLSQADLTIRARDAMKQAR